MLARELELVEEKDERRIFALPAQPLVVGLNGPGEIALSLHASERQASGSPATPARPPRRGTSC
jgi:hypothetical protein